MRFGRAFAKARFYAQLGFERQEWVVLQEALLRFAAEDARLGDNTPFGQKYVVSGTMKGLNGQVASVTVVWIILAGEDFPRLVTAYPGAKS